MALCHAGVPFLPGGYIGVDVFFVISGFLITGFLVRRHERSGRIPFADFYAARARRILPAATLTIVATVIASWHYLNYVRAVSVFHDAIWSTFFAANIHFAEVGTNYFAQDDPPSPLQNFWTLAVEEQFYIVWPALLALTLILVRGRRPLLIAGVAVMCTASLAYCIHDTETSQVGAYFSTVARAWELGVGALLALLTPELSRLSERTRASASWIGVGAILIAGVWFTDTTRFPGYAALLPVCGGALVVLSGLNGMPRYGAGELLRNRPVQLIGDTSYAFYLWHWPILVIVAEYLGHPLTVTQNLGLLLCGFALSVFTYMTFENPIRHARALAMPRTALALWPTTVVMVLGLATIGVASEPALASVAPEHHTIVVKPLSTYQQAVQRSVTPDRLAAPIPKVLYPPVSGLSKDGPTGCVTAGGLGLRCTLGDKKAKRTFAVLGDSHAAAWMSALNYFGVTRHWRLIPLVHAGCTFGIASTGNDPVGNCGKTWWPQVLKRITQLHPSFLVVSQYYDPRVPEAQMYKGLKQELAAFKKRVPRVILIEDPPRHPDIDPVDCLLRSGATLGDCTLTLPSDLVAEHTKIRDILLSYTGDRYLSTRRWFCYGGKCPVVVGRTIAFRDTNHITESYGRQIAPAVSMYLNRLLPG